MEGRTTRRGTRRRGIAVSYWSCFLLIGDFKVERGQFRMISNLLLANIVDRLLSQSFEKRGRTLHTIVCDDNSTLMSIVVD